MEHYFRNQLHCPKGLLANISDPKEKKDANLTKEVQKSTFKNFIIKTVEIFGEGSFMPKISLLGKTFWPVSQ